MKKLWIMTLVLFAAFAFSPAAGAKKKKKGKEKKGAVEEEKPKAPEYMVTLVKGHDAYILNDYDKALKLYKEAAEQSPKSPRPHYFIGCAYRALKKYEDAVDSFKTAYLMAGEDAWWKGMASMNIAVTLELTGDLKAAKKAWEDFKLFAEGKPSLNKFAMTAKSRIKAIETYQKLDEAYEIVRERIAKGD
jgi:tetratricopeptide (TPR) repeat protein